MPSWSKFCPNTGQLHGNAWSCGSCLAENPTPRASSAHTDPTGEIEVIDLVDSPPRSHAAITSFVSPQRTARFSHLDRMNGSEKLRQLSIQRTKKPDKGIALSATLATAIFHLGRQERPRDLITCKLLGKVSVRIFPRTIYSLEDFIMEDLIRELSSHVYQKQENDEFLLATTVTKGEPTFISQSADKVQPVEELLATWFRTKEKGDLDPIHVVVMRKPHASEAEEKPFLPMKKKTVKVKAEPKPDIKVKKEPALGKVFRKRSFSVALAEPKQEPIDIKLADIKQDRKEGEEEASHMELSPSSCCLEGLETEGNDDTLHIAHRTRRRHALQK